jgi:hypothetical protein
VSVGRVVVCRKDKVVTSRCALVVRDVRVYIIVRRPTDMVLKEEMRSS